MFLHLSLHYCLSLLFFLSLSHPSTLSPSISSPFFSLTLLPYLSFHLPKSLNFPLPTPRAPIRHPYHLPLLPSPLSASSQSSSGVPWWSHPGLKDPNRSWLIYHQLYLADSSIWGICVIFNIITEVIMVNWWKLIGLRYTAPYFKCRDICSRCEEMMVYFIIISGDIMLNEQMVMGSY